MPPVTLEGRRQCLETGCIYQASPHAPTSRLLPEIGRDRVWSGPCTTVGHGLAERSPPPPDAIPGAGGGGGGRLFPQEARPGDPGPQSAVPTRRDRPPRPGRPDACVRRAVGQITASASSASRLATVMSPTSIPRVRRGAQGVTRRRSQPFARPATSPHQPLPHRPTRRRRTTGQGA
jgi:hypothetical protein